MALTVNCMSHDCDPLHPSPACPIKVLIVEDEYILAANLSETLEALGYVVTGMADSLITTLQQVEQDRPDVVLMDIWLHGSQDGIGIATLLWDMFQVPTVYLTSNSDRATFNRAYASLPFGYLLKPVRETELVAAINLAHQCSQSQSP